MEGIEGVKQQENDNHIDSHGDLKVERSLIMGFGYGVEDVLKKLDYGMKDAYGNKFNNIFSSNLKDDILTNSFGYILSNLGVQLVKPGDTVKGIQRVITRELWCHSQGCDTFINWANENMLKVEEVYLIAPPMSESPYYFQKLKNASIKAHVQEVIIYRNRGDKKDDDDDDVITLNTQTNSQQPQETRSNGQDSGSKISLSEKNPSHGKITVIKGRDFYTFRRNYNIC